MFLENSLLVEHLALAVGLLTLASFVAGFIDAIAGGAGLILVPSFMLCGMPPQLALGQEKLVSTIGTITAIRNYAKDNKVMWRLVPVGILLALLGAYIGAKAVLYLDEAMVAKIVLTLLPIGLIFTLFKKQFTKPHSADQKTHKHLLPIIAVVSLVVGFYDGFFGPGTGSLFIIALYIFAKIDLIKASATSKIFNFASNIGAFVAFMLAGKMLYKIGIPMILGSLLGNYVGSKLTLHKGDVIVKSVLVVTVIFMIATLAIKFLFH